MYIVYKYIYIRTPSVLHLYILYTLLCVDKYAILQVELRDGCWIFLTCVFFGDFCPPVAASSTCMNSPKISQVGINVYAACCNHLYIVINIYIYMFACTYTNKIIGASNIPYDI